MGPGQEGHPIGADFIGHVPVGRDAVGAHHDGIDASLLHNLGRHVVADQGHRDTRLHELPGGQACALQQRSRFVGVHCDLCAGLMRHVERRQGGSKLRRGQAAGVTVRQNRVAGLEQRGTMLTDGAAHGGIFVADAHGFTDEAFPHLVRGPC